MSQNYTLFVDDQNSNIRYLCPALHQRVTGSFYNNTWSSVDSEDCGNGWWEYSFSGTSVHVHASTAYPGQKYSVKLDNGEFVPQSGNGTYKSPLLSDGIHTITYAVGPGNASFFPAFDYLTVTAGPSTVIDGQTVAVDDQDPSVTYSGNWKTTPPGNLTFDPLTSLYRNTTHWTSSAGDTIVYRFAGTSISVYGILANISNHGNITASYSIDGNTSSRSLGKGTLEFLPMLELFHADLTGGNHTLVMNVTNIAPSQSLGIDFFAYNSSLSGPVGGDKTSSVQPISGSSKPDWAPKVGLIVGVVAGTALLVGGLIIWWQRWRLRRARDLKHLKHQRLDG